MARHAVIPCELLESTRQTIDAYAQALERNAPQIGEHGLTEEEFWRAGIFRSAVEKLRGVQAATTEHKQRFVAAILDYMTECGVVVAWRFSGAQERHDYEVELPGGRLCIIETKGCLDGNNTNIFERPPNADEFLIWSLCQNPGSDPVHNAWSGIHTRLSAEIIHRRQVVDGLIIWDMLCGTQGRPCPKLENDPQRATNMQGIRVPPPCIYLLPRTVPDPRNNPHPTVHQLNDVAFLRALFDTFGCLPDDVVTVEIECRAVNATTERRTVFHRAGSTIAESRWTAIKRAR